ncbi:hypothetical protein HYV71_01920 [Candidatus Uhrbacteria bacterium]|nr:hypothetical protein [Candidatus Uhrbacteria bacterium]
MFNTTTIHIIGLGLQTAGAVIVGLTVLRVHRRVLKEEKIDAAVEREMTFEQHVGRFGVSLIIIGFLVELFSIVLY